MTALKVGLAFIVLGFLAGLATQLLGLDWVGLWPYWVIGGACFVSVFVLRLREIRERRREREQAGQGQGTHVIIACVKEDRCSS